MLTLLLTTPLVPFSMALGLLIGLLALECVSLLLGGSLLGLGGDAEIDIDVPEAPLDIDLPDLGDVDLDAFEPEAVIETGPAAPAGPMAWLGLGKMPVMIWLAAFLMAFGVSGLGLQYAIKSVIGSYLPSGLVVVPAGVAGLWFARSFGAVFARLLPKSESSALSEHSFGRRVGVVTQGTAQRGKPAEVRVTDRFGNTHYLRAEPARDGDSIPKGAEVLVLRHKRDQGYRVIDLTRA